MRAALFLEPEKIEIRDIETPHVKKPYEILVKIEACAVCGTDIRIFHYGDSRIKPPAILGHEIAGEVAEVGNAVTRFKVGDRVAIGADVPCGSCDMCIRGLSNICYNHYAIGFQFPGGFAEYILLNEMTVKYGPVHHIPENVNSRLATLAEPLACCLNGLELTGLSVGDTVAVFGLGPMGCLLIELARYMGAGKIIAIQRSHKRLTMAKQLGVPADVFICSEQEDPIKRILEETEGKGAQIIMIACSSREAQEQAVNIVARRGRINFFAGLPPNSGPIKINSNIIHYREASIVGSHGSTPYQHKVALQLLSRDMRRIERYLTHEFPLEKLIEAFQAMEKRDSIKVIIRP